MLGDVPHCKACSVRYLVTQLHMMVIFDAHELLKLSMKKTLKYKYTKFLSYTLWLHNVNGYHQI